MSSFQEEGAVASQTQHNMDTPYQQNEARPSMLTESSGATLAPGSSGHANIDTAQESRSAVRDDSPTSGKHEITVTETEHTPSFTAGDIIAYNERHASTDRHELKSPITRIAELSMNASTISTYTKSEAETDLESGHDEKVTSWVNNTAIEARTREQNISSLRNSGTTRPLDSFNIPLPDEKQSEFTGLMRFTWFSTYRRLFSIVFAGNLVAIIILTSKLWPTNFKYINLSTLATAASANFAVAILIRQDYISNSLYHICWRIPHSTHPRVRQVFAKVYEQGGVHSGAAVAGTCWFLILTAVIIKLYVDQIMMSIPILTLTCILMSILIIIIAFAWPKSRAKILAKVDEKGEKIRGPGSSPGHNRFEMSHRFGGWLAIALFWAEAMLLVDQSRKTNHTSFGSELVRLPTFWFLAIITFHLVLPWLMLRRWTFEVKKCSGHAVQFSTNHKLEPLSGLAISESPLLEWHPFATFPRVDGTPGTSLIVSAVGDWTMRNVKNPKTQYWVKGFPKTGVLSMALVFKKVVVVTTGSGIGPCLSLMLESPEIRKTQISAILWQANDPFTTYGDELVDRVFDSTKNAVIIDSNWRKNKDDKKIRILPKTHLIPMSYNLFLESGAEAVFVISNKEVTKEVVNGLEKRGVPAYGPIWDS
ncbi:integral membrane protein TmpA [Venturia nashicola]|uniref:Integral membrane protein TmpA n=1 Tax=Venturia nashicola TaxID=86259 RepID=A0A4Z1PDD3_9PEZI|nr:integral membrane protein TmpA [Venturia nashicola]TLD38490.1 integral membrane protein TmpA [Venturia nashicola]